MSNYYLFLFCYRFLKKKVSNVQLAIYNLICKLSSIVRFWIELEGKKEKKKEKKNEHRPINDNCKFLLANSNCRERSVEIH